LALATSLRGGEFDRVWSSPRSRAQETARIGLARAHVITPEIVVDRRLEEIDAGPFEGICFANLFKDTAAGRQYQAYAREIDPVYPKGAESSEDAAARASSFLQEIATLGGGHYLAFSHGGLMRILVCAFLGLDPCHYRRIKIDNCHGVLLKFYEQPPHQLAGLNISPTD
jgi:broad specificity phosphatase PhoE